MESKNGGQDLLIDENDQQNSDEISESNEESVENQERREQQIRETIEWTN